MTADAYTPEEAADALMRCVVRRRGVHDDVTIVVVDVPEPARAFEDDERDDRTSTGGGDDRTVAVSETIEPPPSSSSAATEPPSDGRSRNPRAVEADVTVRRGVSFDLANGVDGDDEKDARKSGGRRGGGGGFGDGGGFGCFSFLCGSRSAGDDAFDAVDDAFSDGSLLDEYDLGAVLGRGQYGSVRLAYRREAGASSVRASSARASSARASSEASASSVKASADASSFPRRAFAVKSVATDGARSSLDRARRGGHHARRVRSAPVSPRGPRGVRAEIPRRRSRGARRDGRVLRRRSRRGRGAPRRDDRAGLGNHRRAASRRRTFSPRRRGGAPRRQARERHAETRVGRRRGAARRARRFRIGGVRSRRGEGERASRVRGDEIFRRAGVFPRRRRATAPRATCGLSPSRSSRFSSGPPTRDVDSAWRALQDGSIPASMRPGDDTPTRLLELVRFMLVADPRARPSASEALARASWLLREEVRDRDGDEDAVTGAGFRATVDAARARYRRSAAFELSVLLDARRAKKLLAELRRESRDATKTSPRRRYPPRRSRRRFEPSAPWTPPCNSNSSPNRWRRRRARIRPTRVDSTRDPSPSSERRTRTRLARFATRSRWRRDAWRTSRSYTRGTVACTRRWRVARRRETGRFGRNSARDDDSTREIPSTRACSWRC